MLTQAVTGLVHLIHLPVVLEQDIVLMDRFDMRKMLNTVVKYTCNELWVVPRMHQIPCPVEFTLQFQDSS
jgi:hypothetical protein